MRQTPGKVFVRLPDWLGLLACLLLAGLWCISASPRLGATFDEPNYLANGLKAWRSGSHSPLLRQGTMPLPVDVFCLPLYLREKTRGVRFHVNAGGRDLRQDDLRAVLPWARLGTLLFAWILIVYGWLLGRHLAGAWGGRLAAVLLATEPSILAHATLATTDVAIAACIVALVYHFDRGRGRTWPWRVGLPGVWFGLALLSKASAIVYAPLSLLVLGAWERLAERGISPGKAGHAPREKTGSRLDRLMAGMKQKIRTRWQALKPLCRDVAWILAIGMAVALIYVGTDARSDPSFVKWARTFGESSGARSVQWLSRHLRIFPNALTGILWQISHNSQGHGVFLLGRSYSRAIWFYFPVAFTIKLTLPLLIAPLVLLLVRPRSLANRVLVCSLVLLAGSIFFRVQIGIRMILPIVALYAVGVAAVLAEATRSLSGRSRRRMIAGIAAGLGWIALSAVRVWPQGLCYANELWGGTARGYLRLSDSNYDWGQGLNELGQWCRSRGIEAMDLWYFGTDPARDHLPFHCLQLHNLKISGLGDITAAMRSRYLAVGTTILYGSYGTEALQRPAAILRSLRPIGRTMTCFIYSFPESSMAAKGQGQALPLHKEINRY
jgi:hypothetical protein